MFNKCSKIELYIDYEIESQLKKANKFDKCKVLICKVQRHIQKQT